MSEANGGAAAVLPKELLRELHAFLCLEAPFLIRDLPRVASEAAFITLINSCILFSISFFWNI